MSFAHEAKFEEEKLDKGSELDNIDTIQVRPNEEYYEYNKVIS